MTNPVAQLHTVNEKGVTYPALAFKCPACNDLHLLPVNTTETTPSWEWNKNLDAPTLSPSILSRIDWADRPASVCHSFLKDGMWQYLADCTHPLVGQTVPMVPLDDWMMQK